MKAKTKSNKVCINNIRRFANISKQATASASIPLAGNAQKIEPIRFPLFQ